MRTLPGLHIIGCLLVLGGLTLPSIGAAQSAAEGTLTLELLQRVERLETEMRRLRGELEMYRYQVEMLEQERSAASAPNSPPGAAAYPPPAAAVEPPLAAPVAPVPAAPAAPVAPLVSAPVPPAAATPAAPVASVAAASGTGGDTERASFERAMGELREGRYAPAITHFQQFLSAYPTSTRAGDAQYWLGESYYLSRDINAAKEAFINLGLRYPESARLPDALLKLGYLYSEQGDTARAREVLQKLRQSYPNTQAASLAERRLQSLR